MDICRPRAHHYPPQLSPPIRNSRAAADNRPVLQHRYEEAVEVSLSRRNWLLAGAAVISVVATAVRPAAAADQPVPTSGSSGGLVELQAASFSLQRPASWEQIDKPGADVLFRDPNRHRCNADGCLCTLLAVLFGCRHGHAGFSVAAGTLLILRAASSAVWGHLGRMQLCFLPIAKHCWQVPDSAECTPCSRLMSAARHWE